MFSRKTNQIAVALAIMICFICTPGVLGAVVTQPILDEVWSDVSVEESQALIDQTKAMPEYLNASKQYSVDENNILVKQFSQKYGSIYMVRMPIADNTGDGFSGLTAFYDENQKLIDYKLFLVTKTKDLYNITVNSSAGQATGTVDAKGNVTNVFVTDSAGTRAVEAVSASGGFWSCLHSCLSNAGIPGYIVGGLSIACAVACVITLGTGCWLCLAGAMGGYSGIGLACYDLCK